MPQRHKRDGPSTLSTPLAGIHPRPFYLIPTRIPISTQRDHPSTPFFHLPALSSNIPYNSTRHPPGLSLSMLPRKHPPNNSKPRLRSLPFSSIRTSKPPLHGFSTLHNTQRHQSLLTLHPRPKSMPLPSTHPLLAISETPSTTSQSSAPAPTITSAANKQPNADHFQHAGMQI